MQKYLTEFIGTFFLVLTIGLAVLSGSSIAPLAIGASLMVMVYMGGHVSGAHYNPAVSLAVFLRGKLPINDLFIYWGVQVAGAVAAALAVYVMREGMTGDRTFAPAPADGASTVGALLVEILYTFALSLVVLNVATAKKTEGNSFYGLAIGFTVFAGAVGGGAVSGGAFNPAVGIGPTLVKAMLGAGTFNHVWLYIVGPLAGGALASEVFKIQEGGSNEAAK